MKKIALNIIFIFLFVNIGFGLGVNSYFKNNDNMNIAPLNRSKNPFKRKRENNKNNKNNKKKKNKFNLKKEEQEYKQGYKAFQQNYSFDNQSSDAYQRGWQKAYNEIYRESCNIYLKNPNVVFNLKGCDKNYMQAWEKGKQDAFSYIQGYNAYLENPKPNLNPNNNACTKGWQDAQNQYQQGYNAYLENPKPNLNPNPNPNGSNAYKKGWQVAKESYLAGINACKENKREKNLLNNNRAYQKGYGYSWEYYYKKGKNDYSNNIINVQDRKRMPYIRGYYFTYGYSDCLKDNYNETLDKTIKQAYDEGYAKAPGGEHYEGYQDAKAGKNKLRTNKFYNMGYTFYKDRYNNNVEDMPNNQVKNTKTLVQFLNNNAMGYGQPKNLQKLIKFINIEVNSLKPNGQWSKEWTGNVTQIFNKANLTEPYSAAVDGNTGVLIPQTKGSVITLSDLHGNDNIDEVLTKKDIYTRLEQGDMIILTGDYVNRGIQSLEVFLKLMLLKNLYPKQVFLLKGNHETKQQHQIFISHSTLNGQYQGYYLHEIVCERYGNQAGKVMNAIWSYFDNLPSMALTANGVLYFHAGLPNKNIGNLRDLLSNENVSSLYYADYKPLGVRSQNAPFFTEQTVEYFFHMFGIKLNVRGHQHYAGEKVLNRVFTNMSGGGKRSIFGTKVTSVYATISLEMKENFVIEDGIFINNIYGKFVNNNFIGISVNNIVLKEYILKNGIPNNINQFTLFSNNFKLKQQVFKILRQANNDISYEEELGQMSIKQSIIEMREIDKYKKEWLRSYYFTIMSSS